jgi:hypothetical protein
MRLTKLFGFIVLLIACVARAYAADATITGIAVDGQGLPLPGVTVTLKAAGAEANAQEQMTDGEGRFTFADLPPGTYTVVLSLSGFGDKEFDAVTVPSNEDLKAVLQLAGFTETVVVKPEPPQEVLISVSPIGEAVMPQQVLEDVPLATERFEDALPLLPGVVRGPDGLLNMNGARADQSSLLMNGINMTDPVTGHFAVRLPLEAIETMNVHAGVYSAAYGNATGGVTNIIIRPGQDKLDFQVQNFMPRLRFHNGIEGFDAFTPRVRISGPIQQGRMWFSQAMSYRFVRTQINELSPRGEDEQKVKSFDSVTQIDRMINTSNHLTGTLVVFPSNIDNAGIDTLHPFDASPDLKQRGWTGSISERTVLSDTTTLSTSAAVKQYDMNIAPKHDDVSFTTVSGHRNNYFNHFDRDSRRYDASATLAIAIPDGWGQHLMRAGGQFARTTYDGIDASQPVIVTGAGGSPIARIDYLGDAHVGADNTEIAGFLQDEWAPAANLTIHGGVRYAYERIAGQQTLAPRVDASFRPFEHGRTVIKGGAGLFYDKLPLNAADFARQQSRRITEFDANGNPASIALVSNQIADDGLRTPNSTAWNVELDQMIARNLLARVGYRRTRGSDQLIVDSNRQDGTQGALLLSSDGRSRSQEFETTLRRQFKNQSHITASYVHSSTKGDLNDFVSLFGDLRDPIIRDNEYARQSFDSPNRFLVWGVMNIRSFTVAPTVEYRTGFPYSVIDAEQNVVGERNAERFPNLFTLDLAVTREVQLTKTRRARVGVQLFNLTNHFNPQDVQNNTGSPTYREFANSVDRQIRTKFTLLF